MHTLSARAQINYSSSSSSSGSSPSFDLLSPQLCWKKRRLPGAGCIAELHHRPWIAGENKLTVEADNQEEVLLRTLITVLPGDADAGYTEILHLGQFLEDCAAAGSGATTNVNRVSAVIQARDKFGNACRSGGAVLSLCATCLSTTSKVHFSLSDRSDGSYVATLTAPLDEQMAYDIHFSVGGVPAKYTPFSITVGNVSSAAALAVSIAGFAERDRDSPIHPPDEATNLRPPLRDDMPTSSQGGGSGGSGQGTPRPAIPSRDGPIATLFQRQHSTVPREESQAERALLDRWRREQATRSRAAAALREERSKLSREKETRLQRAKAKRTGGGFIVQYSRDI